MHPTMLPSLHRGACPAPRVSVLMPTYEQAAFLPRALDSLVAQSLGEWEVIVIDDGSGTINGIEGDEFVEVMSGGMYTYVYAFDRELPGTESNVFAPKMHLEMWTATRRDQAASLCPAFWERAHCLFVGQNLFQHSNTANEPGAGRP